MNAIDFYRNPRDVEDDENEPISDEDIQNGLAGLITGEYGWCGDGLAWEDVRVETYENAGVMTYNKGLVLTLPDGSEFQITIVQSR